MNNMDSSIDNIFRLSFSYSDPLRRKLAILLRDRIEDVLMLKRLQSVYSSVREKNDTRGFIDEILEKLGVTYEVSKEDLLMIPKTGAFLTVANHPFGGIEGLVLSSMLLKIRPDAKIMANYILGRIPELRPVLLCVDPFGTGESVRNNLKPLKEAMGWLKEGHAIAVFPAGEVSHLDISARRVVDPKWHSTIARITRNTGAPVVPVFFEGTNSTLFQIAGMIHPKLRTALLPREFLNKQNQVIRVRIGNIIASAKLDGFNNNEKLMTYLRMRTYALKHRQLIPSQKRSLMLFEKASRPVEAIVAWPESGVTIHEVAHLPPDQLLLRSDEYAVYHARAHQIPNLLYEIGRLRELTFRKSGEGTGKKVDLDRFDLYYTHLFVWNMKKSEVVGAYRMGNVDTILQRFGKEGIYINTLFNCKESLFERLRCGIELGRSFVREEYQRLYSPLLLLWKGITQYVARNPQYTVLFGPVTISNNYSPLSRELMISYLTVNHYAPDLARLIRPRTPMKGRSTKRLGLDDAVCYPTDLEDLSSLVSDLESDRKGIPILLKQYVRLGGKLMGFNIDPAFSNGLDGMIMVDLLKCDRKVLDRYMGKTEAEAFFAFHETFRNDIAS